MEQQEQSQQRQLLERFNPRAVKEVDKGSYKADYVSWTDKIQRLYQIEVPWSWEITGSGSPSGWTTFDQEYTDRKTGEIRSRKVAKPVGGSGDQHEPYWVAGRMSVYVDGEARTVDGLGQGQDLKKAETDAFSRACAKLGLGLHLWCQGGQKDGGYWITGVLDKAAADE